MRREEKRAFCWTLAGSDGNSACPIKRTYDSDPLAKRREGRQDKTLFRRYSLHKQWYQNLGRLTSSAESA